MANLSPIALIIILIVCVVIALVIGYFIGNRAGGDNSPATKREKQKHDDLQADVREHFQQTSAIMSRMVEDYREMYQHMSEGAEKLGGVSREKMVAPPSAEAITHDSDKSAKADDKTAKAVKSDVAGNSHGGGKSPGNAGSDDAKTDKSDKSDTVPNQARSESVRSDKVDDSGKKAPPSSGGKAPGNRRVYHHGDNAGHADSGGKTQQTDKTKAPEPKSSPALATENNENNRGRAASVKSRTSAKGAQNKDAPKSGSQKAPPPSDGKAKNGDKSASAK